MDLPTSRYKYSKGTVTRATCLSFTRHRWYCFYGFCQPMSKRNISHAFLFIYFFCLMFIVSVCYYNFLQWPRLDILVKGISTIKYIIISIYACLYRITFSRKYISKYTVLHIVVCWSWPIIIYVKKYNEKNTIIFTTVW